MKEVRIEWLHHGCPRHGNVFTRLKTAKSLFRNVHRKTVEVYFVRLYNEIDKAAEINQSQFCRLVNVKGNVSERCPGSEFIFNSRVCHDTDSILRGWHDYFKDLYHKNNSQHFDKHFEKEVSSKVAPLYTPRTAIDKGLCDTCVSVQIIESAI